VCAPSLSAPPLDLLSFPTRRSSDLPAVRHAPALPLFAFVGGALAAMLLPCSPRPVAAKAPPTIRRGLGLAAFCFCRRGFSRDARSEEHTSELQSRENLVCRLLLEKK